MNTDESNTKGNIICGRCAYDANPRGATHCQKCGMPLVIASIPNGDTSPSSDSTLLVGGVIPIRSFAIRRNSIRKKA